MNEESIKFSAIAKVLHWISAIVILWATISGLYLATFYVEDATKQQIAQINISVTFIFIPFFFIRILHRIKRGVPKYPQHLSKEVISTAKAMHIALYTLISVVLLSGLFMMKEDFTIFSLFQIHHLINDDTLQVFFEEIHAYSSRILAVCILLHILALIGHEAKGNRILDRMT